MTEENVTGTSTQVPAGETPAAPASTEIKETTQEKQPNWAVRRINELTAKRYSDQQIIQQLKNENEQYRRAVEAQTQQQDNRQLVPADQIPALVQQEASRIADQRIFDQKCNAIFDQGLSEYPDFQEKIAGFQPLGGLSREVIEAASAVGDPHVIFYALAQDLETADRLFKMQPIHMGIEMQKYYNKVKRAPKQSSNAPPPPRHIEGRASESRAMTDDMPMADWITLREQQVAARRQQGR